MDKVQSRTSVEKQFHKKTLINSLKRVYDQYSTPILYLEERAQQIVTSFLEESELFGTGFTKILSRKLAPEDQINKVVIAAVMGEYAITQIERYWHLFDQIFILNLTVSGQEIKQLIRVSPVRKKLRGFSQISLNFIPFIDSVYCANIINKQSQNKHQAHFEESLTSLLTSLPKYHQFKISLIDSGNAKSLGPQLKSKLEQKLGVLESHNSKQYTPVSSPKIRVLVVERSIDQMSPLLYSYHFGPISKQIQVFDQKNIKFTTDSALYSTLFPLDVEEASDFLHSVAQQKADNQKMKFQLNQFQKAKQVITRHYDQKSSPEQIEIQIDALKSVKEFCKRRAFATTLQQTIVNARSQGDQKMSSGKIVDRIVEWSTIPMEQYKPSQEDYIKILILSYMVNSFWFWQRRIINASLQPAHKDRILSFCKKVEGKFKPLQQKPQGQERFDLYRHQPAIVSAACRWLAKDQSVNCINFDINATSVNKQSKCVIAIKGPLGYGQLAMLMKQLKEIQGKGDYLIFCERLVTTKEYLKYLLKQNN